MKRAKEQRAKISSQLALLPLYFSLLSFSLALDLFHPSSFIIPLWLYAPRQVRDLAEELPYWATDTVPFFSSFLLTLGQRAAHIARCPQASLFLEAIARRRCLSGAAIRRSHLHPV